jgi:hypothetical protein
MAKNIQSVERFAVVNALAGHLVWSTPVWSATFGVGSFPISFDGSAEKWDLRGPESTPPPLSLSPRVHFLSLRCLELSHPKIENFIECVTN